MNIDKFKLSHITNTAIMVTDRSGYMRWANEAYAELTGLHLPMWMHRDTGDISREGYIRLHGNGGLLYKIVQKTDHSATCSIDFPKAKDIITTAMPVKSSDGLECIAYILSLPPGSGSGIKTSSGIITGSMTLVDTYMSTASPAMSGVYLKAAQVAPFNTPVVITGESGAGKDVLARFIHASGPRSGGRFVHVNCGALPEALFESEMFGYEAGAFTGAVKGGKTGLAELADGGTLFLDEVAELPLSLQAKLLTFLSAGEFIKVGGGRPVKPDVRVIAATNKDLKKLVDDKLFREDLYYRLNTVSLRVPPLRERTSEIPYFIDYFTAMYNAKYNKDVTFSGDAVELLCMQPWHGNVRELSAVIERLVLFSARSNITAEGVKGECATASLLDAGLSLRARLDSYERELIANALSSARTLHEAASMLDIDLSTLTRKRQKYNL